MEELLLKQNKHLEQIVNLMKTDRLMQLANTYGIHNIDTEDEHASKDLDHIADSIDSFKKEQHEDESKTNTKDKDNTKTIVDSVDKSSKESKKTSDDSKKTSEKHSKEHIAELKKLQKSFKDANFKGVAEKSLATPIFKSIGDKFRDFKAAAINVKDTLTGGNLIKTAGQKIASAISPRYKDRLDYIKNERNLGNRAEDKTLKQNYADRSKFLQRNVANEAMLKKERGSLTEEEFLKGGSKVAKQYEKEKIAVGKGIKATDTRYSIDDKIDEKERKAEVKKDNLKDSTDAIDVVAKKEAKEITPMGKINLKETKPVFGATEEAQLEARYDTKQYQDKQLESNEEQTKIFEEQLDVQNKILEKISGIEGTSETTSSGGGIGETIAAGAKSVLKKGAGVLKKAGSVASKFMGAAAVPLAVGVAGAAVASYAANEFSDSFGEGGFDVVKKLQDDKIIDYNATVMGYNPSEVLDWDGIQKLDPSDLKKLLDSGVEFSPEDTLKLNKIYGASLLTGGKDTAATPKEITPDTSGKVISKEGVSINQKGWEPAATPKEITPDTADNVVLKEGVSINQKGWDGVPQQAIPESITPGTADKVISKEGVSIDQKGWEPAAVKTTSDGYQAYTPKSEDLSSTPIRPVIRGDESEAELDAMTKASGFTIESPKAVVPSVTPPTVGNNVYDISKANSDLKTTKQEAAPVINAPTVNNNTNNTTQNSIVRLQVRDVSTTIQDYFKSRY